MDAVQKAQSGHPGTPMALAPVAYVLWTRFLRFDPEHPRWFDRDRFVLSNGHASMLLYAMLHLTGYDVTLDDLKQFRQWGSKTAGHPELGSSPGVETTTGPLGQGFMNAVGMAMAEAYLAAVYNRPEHTIVHHHTYVFCSDGDLMEGASHEAASLAGHLGLGKLIYIYDDNHITIEGETEITYSDDVVQRFRGYGWHVQDIGDRANDLSVLTESISNAKNETERPSLIIVRSHIAYGAPNKQDTKEAHGSPLGEEEVEATKRRYGWPEDETFLVPRRVTDHFREIAGSRRDYEEWQRRFEAYKRDYADRAEALETAVRGELPDDWDREVAEFQPTDGPMATRSAAGKVLNGFASRIPWLVGGSADLAPSTKSLIEDEGYFAKGRYGNRNIAWGVREHAMVSASSGLALHGGLRPFCSTFFVFTDYARPGIRLSALMKVPLILLMTHDSIALGEDGPTHQPVEHLASFRAMPHMCVIRPADANETAYAWRAAMRRFDAGPTILVLTRQKLPVLDRKRLAGAEGVLRGAYVLAREEEVPHVILIASGSEVALVLEAKEKLASQWIDARVVSMPSWEIFREQPKEYRDDVLPPEVKARLAVETAAPLGWCEWVGDEGDVLGVSRFGASAPGEQVLERYGFHVDNVVERAKRLAGVFCEK
jgi:transketolase